MCVCHIIIKGYLLTYLLTYLLYKLYNEIILHFQFQVAEL